MRMIITLIVMHELAEFKEVITVEVITVVYTLNSQLPESTVVREGGRVRFKVTVVPAIRPQLSVDPAVVPMVVDPPSAAAHAPAITSNHGGQSGTKIYRPQWMVGMELAERVRKIKRVDDWAALREYFKKVDFIMFTAHPRDACA